MKKLTLVRLVNKEYEIVVIDNVIKAIKLTGWKYLEAIKLKEFKLKYNLKDEDFVDRHSLTNKLKLKEKELVADFLNSFKCLPTICQGYYCEDVVASEVIENLEDEDCLFYNEDSEIFDFSLTEWVDFDECFIFWDGQNNKIKWVEDKKIVEVEEVKVEKGDTYQYLYYQGKDQEGNEVKFRVYNSFYQGSLPIIDQDWVETKLNF